MVNLGEILEKKPYRVPTMQIKYLSWEDIVTSSTNTMEGGNNDASGTTLDGNEGNGNDFGTGYTIP